MESKKIFDFYPEIEPYKEEFLKVSNLHTIYLEQSGNPHGKHILFLHGGPGGGTNPQHRQYFDPIHYHIILFDQRGCGKSTPSGELRENTTWDLVDDIEKIRLHLGIEKWTLFGGSWGSTLALAYGITYPERVVSFILRGIFLCRPSEIYWFYQFGASELFPDYWEKFLEPIPESQRNHLLKSYYTQLTHEDGNIRLRAAKTWSQWEAATSRLLVDPRAIDEFEDPEKALAFARIECHYFMNNAFFFKKGEPSPNFLLEEISKIRQIPATIVQGRYDVVCPARSAWDLHRAWPEAQIRIIADAGHAAAEPGICKALIEATNSVIPNPITK